MILADTSVWIDHLSASDARLAQHLRAGRLGHPLVIAEIALGSLRDRPRIWDCSTASRHSLWPTRTRCAS